MLGKTSENNGMESKKCNKCGKKKPINMFYKLRADREWRRSKCIPCHRSRDDINRKVRKGLLFITLVLGLGLISAPSFSQRKVILDSINYFRAAPIERVQETYGIKLSKAYKPIAPYKEDERLTRSAQRYAERMARSGNYWHSRTKYNESIDAIQDWQGGAKIAASRFIIDQYVKDKGHRKHMLLWPDTLIGIGIAKSKTGETYVCIQTTSSSASRQ